MPPSVKIQFSKPPRSFSDQVQILQSHGISIPDPKKAEFYLSQLNYYRLAAYCLPFEQTHSNLQNDVKKSNEDFIRHFKAKYQETLPPIWAVVELMTMGQLSKWFSNIKTRQDRMAICQIYNLDEKVMTSFCEHLSLVRNIAAHHARLWNRDISKKMKIPTYGPNDLRSTLWLLPDTDRRLKKIYNTFTMTQYLMNVISPDNHWKERLKALITTHAIDSTKMGFPPDWANRPLWQS